MLPINDINKIIYYVNQCEINNIDVRGLRSKIKSKEYERLDKETKLKLINKEENVLVEGFSSKNSDLLMGYTETNKLVNFKGDPSLIGKIVKVKILDAKTWSLDGEYVE